MPWHGELGVVGGGVQEGHAVETPRGATLDEQRRMRKGDTPERVDTGTLEYTSACRLVGERRIATGDRRPIPTSGPTNGEKRRRLAQDKRGDTHSHPAPRQGWGSAVCQHPQSHPLYVTYEGNVLAAVWGL